MSAIRRTVTTSPFGFYQFNDVPTSESYIIAVKSRRYRFADRIVVVMDTLTDFDFTGLE